MQLTCFKTLFFLLLFSVPVMAQNNNLMAKVAYENAEAALESKNFSEGISELATVDKLLGKLTPKSQYLRVQLWAQAAETNPLYVDSALLHSKNYLGMASSFDIAEEKQLEVARLVQKLEKSKAAMEAKAKADIACREKLKKLQADVLTRDQNKIAAITGFDWDQDVLKQLKAADRFRSGSSKYNTAGPIFYNHIGVYYEFAGTSHPNLSDKTKGHRIKGIDPVIKDLAYVTNASGTVQTISSTLTEAAEKASGVITAISNLLGFPPDENYKEPHATNPVTYWYWWFKDYTVSIMSYPYGSNHFSYVVTVHRHYPGRAKVYGKAPFADCK